MIYELLITLAGAVLLYAGAESLVRSSVSLSNRFRIPPMLIGLVIIGLGTSSPELVVSIEATLKGSGEIAVGNVVGSNISNIALILGIAALIWPVRVARNLISIEVPVLIAASLLMAILVYNGWVTRINGLLMLAGLGAYIIFKIRSHSARTYPETEEWKGAKRGIRSFWLVLGTLAGLILLIFGAELMITGAIGLAETYQLSEAVIGLTIVAVGTSLPELATAISAALRKQGDLILGGLIGSNILNILFVLGITAVVRPIELTDITSIDLLLMTLLAVIIWPIFRSDYLVSRFEGVVLLLIYTGYIAWLFIR